MDVMDASTTLLPGAHRTIRRVDEHESAFSGALVVAGEDVRVRVAAEDADTVLWRYAGAEHVAGVLDVVRRTDGHDVLLPWCPDRVDAFLGRRASAERPLAPGEIVTLTGSMLRGLEEVDEDPVSGCWWLADDARPLFVPGEGSPCAAATREVVARLRAACVDRAMERLLGEIERMPDDLRAVRRVIPRWEGELSELAAPRAIERDVFVPERVSEFPAHRALLPQTVEHVSPQRSGGARRRDRAEPVRDSPLSALPGVVTARLSLITVSIDELRGRLHRWAHDRRVENGARTNPRRSRVVAVGAAAAGMVLVVGLIWPTDGGSEATERLSAAHTMGQPASDGSQTASRAETATPVTDPPPTQPRPEDSSVRAGGSETRDIASAARDLLEAIAACSAGGDGECRTSIVADAANVVLERLAGAGTEREITPVEDYGDVAVLRLGETSQRGEQMLVLVREKDRWLVRDVYDVADQPSGKG